jgi:hypothetical protein
LPPDPVDHVQGEGRRWHFAIAERQTDRRIGTVQVEPRARWQPIVAMVDVSNAPALRLATRVGFTPGRVVIEYGTEQQIFTAPLRAIANSVEPA